MAQETNPSPAPLLCSTGCGFFSSPRNHGMCSVCYRDFLLEENSSARTDPPGSSADCSVSPSPTHTPAAPHSGSSPASESSQPEEEPSGPPSRGPEPASEQLPHSPTATQEGEEPKAKKNRCFTCRKKVGLTGVLCRCGKLFCASHRYSDAHGCSFDYRAEAAARLRRENPLVAAEKLHKI